MSTDTYLLICTPVILIVNTNRSKWFWSFKIVKLPFDTGLNGWAFSECLDSETLEVHVRSFQAFFGLSSKILP